MEERNHAFASGGTRKRRRSSRLFELGGKVRGPYPLPTGIGANKIFSQAAQALLASPIPGDPQKLSFAEGICKRLGWMALGGDLGAIKELLDRAEGRPRKAVDINDREDPLAELIRSMREVSERLGPPEGQAPHERKEDELPDEPEDSQKS